jgi:iron(III) transport system ATP-binding protein
LLASHDPHDTLSWADEILVIKEGAIIQQGTPKEIYYKPLNEYVAGLFGKYNLLTAEQASWFEIKTNEKELIIRPEDFKISSYSNNGIKGTIQEISFWGSFYEAQVRIKDLVIVVRTGKNECTTGDEVFVSIN